MNRVSSITVGLCTLVILVIACAWGYRPAPDATQLFKVTFRSNPPGTADPVIVTGRTDAADFLAVNYLDTETINFRYDSWGRGGPVSAPIKITPGRVYSLGVEFPSLAALSSNALVPDGKVKIVLDGQVVLTGAVTYHQRNVDQVWFGQNPIKGSSSVCGRAFHGILELEPTVQRTTWQRLLYWFSWGRWQLAACIVLSVVSAWLWRIARSYRNDHSTGFGLAITSALRAHRTFLIIWALCGLAFSAVITAGSFRLIYPETFGEFYDHQALSLLRGRLDVPSDCLWNEAFIYGGRSYGYFGPTPALLRLPLMIFGVAFESSSRAAMLIYYLITLAGAYAILRDMTRLFRSEQPEPTSVETVLFVSHIGLGSTVVFLGSRAFTYHEAILCGIMFAVWAGWSALRQLTQPTSRWWRLSLLLGLLSIHARPTTGLFALLLLACCVAIPARQHLYTRRWAALRRPVTICLMAGLGIISFNVLSYAKFRTFEGCPLSLNVQYDVARIARIDGRQFHLANIPYGLDVYFLRPRIEITKHFPWLATAETPSPESYEGAKLDLPDRAVALPIGMMGLFFLSTVGCALVAWHSPATRECVAALWISFVLLVVPMCAAVATAERYTGDFVPFLICAGAIGFVARGWKRSTLIAFGLMVLWSVILTAAVTLDYQGKVVWGVAPEITQRYEQWREQVDRFFKVIP